MLFLPKTLYGADVDAALAKLRADPAVKFADVDQIRHIETVTPNDPLFAPTPQASPPASGQWYLNTPSSTPIIVEGNTTEDLSATDAVTAWGITNGSPGIVIADVDTGVRFDHPDLLRAGLGGRLLPGYDFVGEDLDPSNGAAEGTYLIANDGDGWDPDPSDPGDWISTSDTANALFANDTAENSSWHGTRVVGVYGAITNNDVGIAGMTWGSWVLPVRALGKGGGYDSDIIAGIEWAAGLPVTNPDGPPVPDNPFPADIVNLSLGGSGSCPSDYQDALAAGHCDGRAGDRLRRQRRRARRRCARRCAGELQLAGAGRHGRRRDCATSAPRSDTRASARARASRRRPATACRPRATACARSTPRRTSGPRFRARTATRTS